ncbi:GLPGLI family protein [Soonwooa sp.]|uniref:GLPGLI family protein n=1 Tax=Soonwooa sp. TaxID=1938592 RepID=UPI00263394EB|nr:GLPGLI family protein [Soonwooa sp.]
MRLIFIFCLAFSINLFAQNQRYVYEYKLVKDSTDKANQRTEMMCLDTSKEGSRFYSYTAYHSDSLMRANLEMQLKATGVINVKSDMRIEAERYSVSKSYPDFKTELHNRIGMDSYKILDDRKLNWKILSDTQQIGKWKTQKATLDFGGRHWIAWFTNDIPLQDGPYKFHGLPGLIVKIEDKTQSHILELKAIKNLSLEEFNSVLKPKNEIALSLKQYQKVLEDYANDPTKGFKQATMGGIVMTPTSGDNKWIKEREAKMKEDLKKDNNKIELSFK